MKGIIYLGLCASSMSYAQADSAKIKEIEAVNFTKRLPVTKEIIRVENLAQKNLGQDLPMLLKNQTSVLSSSDTGNGVGYSDFRIRGVAGTSINVMMNGVPYNDSESQGTFFVNVSDLASSASQILIQRGVGSTSNGAAAFGASVNIITKTQRKRHTSEPTSPMVLLKPENTLSRLEQEVSFNTNSPSWRDIPS